MISQKKFRFNDQRVCSMFHGFVVLTLHWASWVLWPLPSEVAGAKSKMKIPTCGPNWPSQKRKFRCNDLNWRMPPKSWNVQHQTWIFCGERTPPRLKKWMHWTIPFALQGRKLQKWPSLQKFQLQWFATWTPNKMRLQKKSRVCASNLRNGSMTWVNSNHTWPQKNRLCCSNRPWKKKPKQNISCAMPSFALWNPDTPNKGATCSCCCETRNDCGASWLAFVVRKVRSSPSKTDQSKRLKKWWTLIENQANRLRKSSTSRKTYDQSNMLPSVTELERKLWHTQKAGWWCLIHKSYWAHWARFETKNVITTGVQYLMHLPQKTWFSGDSGVGRATNIFFLTHLGCPNLLLTSKDSPHRWTVCPNPCGISLVVSEHWTTFDPENCLWTQIFFAPHEALERERAAHEATKAEAGASGEAPGESQWPGGFEAVAIQRLGKGLEWLGYPFPQEKHGELADELLIFSNCMMVGRRWDGYSDGMDRDW